MDRLKIVTYNVRGLREKRKRREVFNYIHLKKFEVTFMQETHSVKQNEKCWSWEFGTKIWMAHYNSDSRGVAIAFAKTTPIKVHNSIADIEGRFLILYTTLQNKKWLFVNLYAPNKDDPIFFDNLFNECNRGPVLPMVFPCNAVNLSS